MPLELTLDALRKYGEDELDYGVVRGLRFPYLSRLTRSSHFRKSQPGSTFRVEFDEMPKTLLLETLMGFASLGRDERLSHSRHVFAYFREMHEGISPEEAAEEAAAFVAPIKKPRDVWRNVWVHSLRVSEREGTAWMLVSFGCAWEQEHGMSMSFEGGHVITRVGGIDGHACNTVSSGSGRSRVHKRSPLVHAGRRYPTQLD